MFRDFLPEGFEARPQFRRRRAAHPTAGRDDDIYAGQLVLVHPEGFLHGAPHSISLYGVTRRARGNGESDPRSALVVGVHDHAEEPIRRDTSSLAVDSFEVRFAAQSPLSRKGVAGQGISFLRPFARRRARTFWPFAVAIRARNPCVRARLTLLG